MVGDPEEQKGRREHVVGKWLIEAATKRKVDERCRQDTHGDWLVEVGAHMELESGEGVGEYANTKELIEKGAKPEQVEIGRKNSLGECLIEATAEDELSQVGRKNSLGEWLVEPLPKLENAEICGELTFDNRLVKGMPKLENAEICGQLTLDNRLVKGMPTREFDKRCRQQACGEWYIDAAAELKLSQLCGQNRIAKLARVQMSEHEFAE